MTNLYSSKFREIYAKASRLGLDLLPSSATDEEQLQHIAEQLGMDYDGTPAIESEMFDALEEMEAAQEYDDAMGYDQDMVEEYGREPRESHKVEKKNADGTDGNNPSGEGSETTGDNKSTKNKDEKESKSY